jgi:glutamate-ammonia-ligase adenylyltransferase
MVYKEFYTRLMERIRADLSEHTEEGYAYRVDLRLRPFGSAGELISSFSRVLDYYRDSASLWEIQAALKMRPVGGNLKLGYDFIQKLHPILFQRRSRESIVGAIEGMRQKALQSYSDSLRPTIDVKSGTGGIRDVEFLVQGLQLIYGPDTPSIIEGNTMTALDLLREGGILPGNVVEQLQGDYIYLRRTEHYLQILEDRQIHSLPTDPHELTALAKRMMGLEGSAERFMEELQSSMERIRGAYSCHLLEG